MTSREFAGFRKKIGKSQRDMARLLGLSIKAVHSYEQGWRKIPGSVERQVFFLYSMHRGYPPPAHCLLVGQELPAGSKTSLSRLGVSLRSPLLVHQRDLLPGGSPKKLEG